MSEHLLSRDRLHEIAGGGKIPIIGQGTSPRDESIFDEEDYRTLL